VPENLDLTGGLVDERTDDTDRGGLARTIRPKQGIEVTGFDVEIDSLQCLQTSI
jgi:hypothetical protein